MAHDVFISHSAKNKATADAVCATLESEGVRCWIAPRDVTPGMEWGECIIDAIEQTRIMVLVFTSEANASPQIRREVERAVNHDVVILPVRLEDVMPARALEYFIGNVHWLDAITPPLEAHLRNLASTIKMLLLRIPSASPPPMPHAEDASARPAPPAPPPEPPARILNSEPPTPGWSTIAPAPPDRPVPHFTGMRVDPPPFFRGDPEPAQPEPAKPEPVKPEAAKSASAPEQARPGQSDSAPSGAFGFRKLEAVEFPRFDPPPRPRTPESRGPAFPPPIQPVREESRQPDPPRPEPRQPAPAPEPIVSPKRTASPATTLAGSAAATTLVLLFALNLLNSAARSLLLAEGGLISEHRSVSSSDFLQLQRVTPLWYALAALLVGWLGDRIRRKPLILAAGALFSVLLLGMYVSMEFSTMFLDQSLIWFVGGIFDVFALATIADLFSERRRPLAFMLFALGYPLGTALAGLDVAIFSPTWGWGIPLVVPALLGGAATGIYAWRGREPQRGANDSIAPAPGSALARLFTSPACILLLVAAAALRLGGTANNWALHNLSLYWGISPSVAQRSAGIGFALTSFLGILAGGVLGWLWLRKNHRALYLVAAAGAGLAFVFFAVVAFGPESVGMAFILFTNLFVSVPTALVLAAFANAAPASAHTTAFSFLMGLSVFFGVFLWGPVDHISFELNLNMFGAVRMAAPVFLVAGIVLFIAARFAPALGAEKKRETI